MRKNWVKPKLEHMKETPWGWRVWHPDRLTMGENVDIGCFSLILAHAGVTIEDDVQIGSHCTIHSADTERGVSGPVKLERGCHIGAGTLIYPNVTVGRNAVIGAHSTINANIGEGAEVKAHSLVLTDVPKGRTVFGVPAR